MKELLEAILALILFITEPDMEGVRHELGSRTISKCFPFSAPQFTHLCPGHNEVFSNSQASRLNTLIIVHSSLSS